MIFVFRGGILVPKGSDRDRGPDPARSDLPSPMLSRLTPFESPVTGKEISSWRERDRDMAAVDAVDPRDLAPPSRGRAAQKKEAEHAGTFKWTSDQESP